MKKFGVPLLLFIISAILSISALHMALASFIIGSIIIIFAFLRTKIGNESLDKPKSSRDLLVMRAGIVLTVTPITTVTLVLITMLGISGAMEAGKMGLSIFFDFFR